jgi:hypothetical protein
MRYCLSCASAVLAAAFLLSVTPVSANTAESQENSSYTVSVFASFASKLKVESEQALAAAAKTAAQAIEESKAALAEAEKDLAPRLETFRLALNEQKARLGTIGQDAAARLRVWKEDTATAWNETWSDTWTQSWADIHRSTMQTLDRFRDWIAKRSVSDEKSETPV